MSKTKTETPEEIQRALLDAALPHVPFDGWSEISLNKAARDLGLDDGAVRLAFPGGVRDLVNAFVTDADARMQATLEAQNLDEMKIRERITSAVRTRIEAVAPNREAERRALSYMAMPFNAPLGLHYVSRTVDLMWRAAGDTSTDFNFYTKRMILGGVYSSTMVFWLNDHSEDYADTWAFLDRRIEDVMKIEKVKAKVRKATGDMPSLTRFLARVRYPSETRMKP